jgi:hypothetical protein
MGDWEKGLGRVDIGMGLADGSVDEYIQREAVMGICGTPMVMVKPSWLE